jgi:uncharacterized protein
VAAFFDLDCPASKKTSQIAILIAILLYWQDELLHAILSTMKKVRFDWDEDKDRENQNKHKVSFSLAQEAFLDPDRIIAEDITHSAKEDRFYCIGKAGGGVMTVRFTYRGKVIRIYGAAYWRRGRKIYEEQNKIHG